MTHTKKQEELIRDGSRLARLASDSPHAVRERFDLASLLVEMRATFKDSDGRPDYRGSTRDYRQAVAQMYERSGLRKADRERVRRAVQHHVSNILRDVLTPGQLAEYGLSTQGQNARRQERRQNE